MNSNKNKGDRAEREAAQILSQLTGLSITRNLSAGIPGDVGDLYGLSGHVVQVANWKDIASALRIKPPEAEIQRQNAMAKHAITMIRLRGGDWRIALTLEQWKTYWDLINK